MKNKINIAELLKDCPKGMELYSPIFGKVYLDKIRPHLAIAVTTDKEQGNFKEEFLYDGRYGMNGECMLFPSKDKTWEGFVPPCQFKDGDVVVITDSLNYSYIVFYNKNTFNLEERYTTSGYNCTCKHLFIEKHICYIAKNIKFATEEEKQKLFDVIKANGYKWNAETKTLEIFVEPKFKVGDRIKEGKTIATVVRVCKDVYDIRLDSGGIGAFSINLQDRWELVPNKFDINTLKPFDKVLARCSTREKWRIQLFEKYDKICKYPFICMGYNKYKQCIPYEGNGHLLDTADNCNDFYKTW